MSMQQSQMGQQSQGQNNRQWRQSHRTVLSITADAPTPDSFSQLAQRLQGETGIREVTLFRDGPTPKIRIKATQESLPRIQNVVSQVIQTVQQAYGEGSQYQNQGQNSGTSF